MDEEENEMRWGCDIVLLNGFDFFGFLMRSLIYPGIWMDRWLIVDGWWNARLPLKIDTDFLVVIIIIIILTNL